MNFLVVDPHPLVGEGVGKALLQIEADLRIESFSNDEDALLRVRAYPARFDLMVLGLDRDSPRAAEAIRSFRRAGTRARIIVLSSDDSRLSVTEALAAGAQGFVSKRAPPEILVGAARLVLSGGTYIPPSVLGRDSADMAAGGRKVRPAVALTERQTDVLALLVEGKPNKLICRELKLSEGTVKTHVSAIFRALNVSNRTQVAFALSRLGWQPNARGAASGEAAGNC